MVISSIQAGFVRTTVYIDTTPTMTVASSLTTKSQCYPIAYNKKTVYSANFSASK